MEYRTIYRLIFNKKPKPHVVITWPFWLKGYVGFTLGFIIFVKDRRSASVVVHELVHVDQFYRQPFTFWARYLYEAHINGYKNNKYEIEAHDAEREAINWIREPSNGI